MSQYIKATNFTAKDALPAGNSSKVVKGAEIDTEFTAIAAAISSKSDSNSPTFTGSPLAPTAAAGTNNTQIATTAFATTAATASFPSGGIIMWSGSIASIPSGWVLCNGSNNTPDLRDRFIVGAGSTFAVDATGGFADSTLPTHTHTATDSGHAHAILSTGRGRFEDTLFHDTFTRTSTDTFGGVVASNAAANNGTSTETANISVNNAGVSGVGTNLPPYFALAYIMKT